MFKDKQETFPKWRMLNHESQNESQRFPKNFSRLNFANEMLQSARVGSKEFVPAPFLQSFLVLFLCSCCGFFVSLSLARFGSLCIYFTNIKLISARCVWWAFLACIPLPFILLDFSSFFFSPCLLLFCRHLFCSNVAPQGLRDLCCGHSLCSKDKETALMESDGNKPNQTKKHPS